MRCGFPLAFSLFLLLSAGALFAHAEPAQVTRVLRTIDFEERAAGIAEEAPDHWIKAENADMPHYVIGRLSSDRARSGRYSFRFDLNGGSLTYRYEAGRIRIQSGARYRVETWCRTTAMPNARARMTAWMADEDGRPIVRTRRSSALYSFDPADRDDWHSLDVEVDAPAQAISLVIELELLQPRLYAPATLGERVIWPQDIHGTAWFDDVTVSQVPEVRMFTDRPGNIFPRGIAPALSVAIRDRYLDDLASQLTLRNARGQIMHQRSGRLDVLPAEDLGPRVKRATLVLPSDLAPGWYEALLTITGRGQRLGEQTMALVLLADDASPTTPDDRFGIDATSLPFDAWGELPDLLPFLSAGRVKLGVWSAAGDVEMVDPAAFDRLLLKFQELHITPTACLLALPPAVAAGVKDGRMENLLSAPAEVWKQPLSFLISRHANHLDRWQLGADGSDAFVTRPEMRKVYDAIYEQFGALVQHPDLAMPWPAWYELSGELPATVALSVPSSVLPAQIPLYMQDLKRHEGHNLSLSFELLDRQRYGREGQIRDLAQRVVYALAADARRIDVPLPFKVQREGDQLVKQPEELLLVLRSLIKTLGGTTFKGKVPIADNVEAFLFEKNGRGILVVWDSAAALNSKPRELSLHLGEHPSCVDLFGNSTPLLSPESVRKDGQVLLSLSSLPVFITDIDCPLAQLRASVTIDKPLLESSFMPHSRKLRFTNPYKLAIAGQVKLSAPNGWTLTPSVFNFSLNPGETFERDLTLEFPYSSIAGDKTITANFQLQADHLSRLSAPITLRLGLSDVGMQSVAVRDGSDIIVQQIVTNYGEKPIDYSAFALLPGSARQERMVSNLGGGRTTIKRYRFSNIPADVKPHIRLGLKQIDGARILNEEVDVQ